jgi:thymidylate kinase
VVTTVPTRPPGPAPPELDSRPLTRTILAALDRAGVRWCLIRGRAGGGDVDVLVSAGDLVRATAEIERHGLLRLRAYGRGSHRFFLGLDEPTCSFVEFDLVTELTFGPRSQFRTGAAAVCLARRRWEAGVWLLAPEDEFWALLLHCLLDNGGLAERHVVRLGQLAPLATVDSPLASAMPAAAGAAALLEDVRAGRWPALAAAGPRLRGVWSRARPAEVVPAAARNAVLRLAERPLQAWSRRGVSVALLGPDGSGKSTVATGLAAAFYFPVRRVYLGLWPAEDRPPGRLGAAYRIARRPVVAWRRYLAGVWHRAMGRLVVFDRYVYDALLPPRGSLTWLKRPYFGLLGRCCPAPDLVVLLDAPGPVLHARSGEYDPTHLAAERDHYARLAGRLRNVVRVDAQRPREAVLAEVVGHAWRLYQDRGRGGWRP